MVIYVLDASAVLRFLEGEAGVTEVTAMFRAALSGQGEVISAVNWGEVVGKLHSTHRSNVTRKTLARLLRKKLQVVPATAERAAAAALIKFERRIPYADAFGVELASDSPDHVLVTADFDIKPAESIIKIVFLPTKTVSTKQ